MIAGSAAGTRRDLFLQVKSCILSAVVYVQEVDLTRFDVRLPAGLIGMVVMQPFLDLTDEPFRWQPARRVEQIAAIEHALGIARSADHGAEKTHFTVIPEYSIPGLDNVARMETVLRDPSWPAGTIVI